MIQTVNPEISGDVGGLTHFGLDKMDLSQPKVEFQKSSVLKSASDDVKRGTFTVTKSIILFITFKAFLSAFAVNVL